MNKTDDEKLKLENQLCFPLYACSKEVVRRYKPFLDKIDLTYTQYIVMLVLWEEKSINVKKLGEFLYLDSGTLTPLLKKLQSKGYISRTRMKTDERSLLIEITDKGMKLKDEAVCIPSEMRKCINLSDEETLQLYKLLNKMLEPIKQSY